MRSRTAVSICLLCALPTLARAQAREWITHTDSAHGYAFDHPAAYRVEGSAASVFLVDGPRRTEFYVENWTKPVVQGRTTWDLSALAGERALSACAADGPDCSRHCALERSEDVANPNGIHVVAVVRKRFDTCDKRPPAVLNPIYVADLSTSGSYVLLIVAPRDGPELAPDVVRSIVATIRRVPSSGAPAPRRR